MHLLLRARPPVRRRRSHSLALRPSALLLAAAEPTALLQGGDLVQLQRSVMAAPALQGALPGRRPCPRPTAALPKALRLRSAQSRTWPPTLPRPPIAQQRPAQSVAGGCPGTTWGRSRWSKADRPRSPSWRKYRAKITQPRTARPWSMCERAAALAGARGSRRPACRRRMALSRQRYNFAGSWGPQARAACGAAARPRRRLSRPWPTRTTRRPLRPPGLGGASLA
mmetsp:Transcript_65419/g.191439  ORF Transcript_65419/g.191439 Transcript_65419/m.191439 type:complete len:225 (+) Transcript_65419:342-1016(+)